MDVSCKPIIDLVTFLENRNVDPQLVLKGAGPFDSIERKTLTTPETRISWEQMTATFSRAGKILSKSSEIVALAKFLVADSNSALMTSVTTILKGVTAPALLYDIAINLVGMRYFPTAWIKYDSTGSRFQLSVEIPDRIQNSKFLFSVLQNILEHLPEKIGYPPAIVTSQILGNQCKYMIIPPVSSNLAVRIWRWIISVFAAKETIRQLINLETSIERKQTSFPGASIQQTETPDCRTPEVDRFDPELSKKHYELIEIEELSRTGTLTFNRRTGKVSLSRYAAKIFGVVENKPITFDQLLAHLHPEDQKEFSIAFARISPGRPDFYFEYRMITRDTYYIIQQRGRLVSQGEEQVVISSIFDVTNIRQNEIRLARDREVAVEESRNKSLFLASMSHEIRTPMTSVLGFAELIKHPKSSPQNIGSYIETILRNGKHLLCIIDDILDLSKVESGHLRFNCTRINTRRTISEALEDIKSMAEKKDIRFNVHLSQTIPEEMITDSNRFLQIINNVLSNTVKFTDRGVITVTIEASLSAKKNDGIKITVEDTGGGMSSEFCHLLFSPYAAFDMENRKRNTGTGLGLALAKALAVPMEGDIKLLSGLEVADRKFAITLHSMPAAAELSTPLPENFPIAIDRPASGPLLKSWKILITEDNKDIQQILKKIVEDAGASTEIANNGQECLDLVKEINFDIVLMDLQMPVMDGFEAIERLRSDGFKRPIVVVTAYAISNERERCIKAGCTDFVTKPINADILLRTLARHRTPKSTPIFFQ